MRAYRPPRITAEDARPVRAAASISLPHRGEFWPPAVTLERRITTLRLTADTAEGFDFSAVSLPHRANRKPGRLL